MHKGILLRPGRISLSLCLIVLAMLMMVTVRGLFKCYVTQMGVGGVTFSGEKALQRCKVQRY